MQCPQCGAANEESNRYCSRCGTSLAASPAGEDLDRRVDRALEQRFAESEIFNKVLGRATSWVKVLGTLAGLLVLILGWFGFSAVLDIREMRVRVEATKETVEGMKDDVERVKTDVETLQMAMRDQVDTAKRELGDTLASARSDSLGVQAIRDDILAKAEGMRTTLDDLELQVDQVQLATEQVERLDRLENAEYRITVHLDSAVQDTGVVLDRLKNDLGKRGFRIRDEDLLELEGVDANRIIYYSRRAAAQAEDLRKLLAADGLQVDVEERLLSGRDYDLQLELHQAPKPAGDDRG